MKEIALVLAAEGWRVFPCYNVTKAPATRNGHKNATTDPVIINRWYWPGRLIGIPAGELTGWVVLDIDPRHGGDRWLQENIAKLPRTFRVQTRSGGEHWYFKPPPGGLRNSDGANNGIAPGVDTRGDGGYVICWPAHGLPIIDDAPLAEWPDWLVLPEKKPPQTNGFGGLILTGQTPERLRVYAIEELRMRQRRVSRSPHGVHNSLLNRETYYLGEHIWNGSLTEEEVREAMTRAGLVAGHAEHRITRTLNSAFRKIRERIRYIEAGSDAK